MVLDHFVSVGEDRRPILWKLDRESQVIFDEQNYFLDAIYVLNKHFFVTGDV